MAMHMLNYILKNVCSSCCAAELHRADLLHAVTWAEEPVASLSKHVALWRRKCAAAGLLSCAPRWSNLMSGRLGGSSHVF